MKVIIQKKIGTALLTFEVEEDKTKDVLYRASNFTTMPESCSLCKSTDLELDGNKAEKEGKTYTYVKVKCRGCGARATMGENMDGINVFWKGFEKYEPKTQDKSDSEK